MTLDELDRIEADAQSQSHLQLARTIAMTPGKALELCRLARIGMEAEAVLSKPRAMHEDNGA